MSRHVVIIGGGIAGLSTAFAALASGFDVTLVSAGVGATALGTGAIDDLPWEAWFSAARTLGEPLRLRAVSDDVRAFSDALGLWDLPSNDAHVPLLATAAGRLRPTRGRDKGLLDLGSLGKTTVLVPRVPRAGWDADALAATLESEWLARQSGLRFLPVDAPIFRFTDEARIPDADLAMRHDEPARLEWFAERLREMVNEARQGSPSISAVLLGSWLGIKQERATELSLRVGVPVGEVLVGVGSSAGMRFENAMPMFLERLSVKFVSDRVTKILRIGERFEVVLATGASSIVADAIVIATGGVAAGSIVYSPPDLQAGEEMPPHIEPSFSFAIETPDIPITLGCDGDRFDAGSSVFGPSLDTTAWPSNARASTLESVGIEASNGKVCPGVYAAGDVVADKRRTILDAVAAGLRAGRIV